MLSACRHFKDHNKLYNDKDIYVVQVITYNNDFILHVTQAPACRHYILSLYIFIWLFFFT